MCHFPSIIYLCLEASENLFRIIFAGKPPDAGARLFIFPKLFDGWQNLTASGMHAIQWEIRVYIESLPTRRTVVSRVLFLNSKNAARRAASENRAEVFFLKKKSQLHCFLSDPHCVFAFMFSLVVFHLLANNCTIEMYSILGADKLRRMSSLQFTNALQFL